MRLRSEITAKIFLQVIKRLFLMDSIEHSVAWRTQDVWFCQPFCSFWNPPLFLTYFDSVMKMDICMICVHALSASWPASDDGALKFHLVWNILVNLPYTANPARHAWFNLPRKRVMPFYPTYSNQWNSWKQKAHQQRSWEIKMCPRLTEAAHRKTVVCKVIRALGVFVKGLPA